jgi:hypothetical protein
MAAPCACCKGHACEACRDDVNGEGFAEGPCRSGCLYHVHHEAMALTWLFGVSLLSSLFSLSLCLSVSLSLCLSVSLSLRLSVC